MRAVLKEMLHTIDVAITSEYIDSVGVTFRNGDSVHSRNVKLTPGLLYMHHGMAESGDWEVFDVEEIVSVKVCLLDSVPDRIRHMSLPSFLTMTLRDHTRPRAQHAPQVTNKNYLKLTAE